MHRIYTLALRAFFSLMLKIVVLDLCNGKTIPIETIDERPQILTAYNATVAQTIVGIDDSQCMK